MKLHRISLLLVTLCGACTATNDVAPPSQPVGPPPMRGATLRSGFRWPSSARALPSPRFSPGIVRPIDHERLLKRVTRAKSMCAPILLANGDLAMAGCGAPRPLFGSPGSVRMGPPRPRARVTTRVLGIDGGATPGAYPPSANLAGTPLDGPVKDQQQAGVCWSFAMSEIMENSLLRHSQGDVVAPLHLIESNAWDAIWSDGRTKPMVNEPFWPYDPAKACKLEQSGDPSCEAAYHVSSGSWQQDPQLSSEVASADTHGTIAVTEVHSLPKPPRFDDLAAQIADGVEAYLSVDIDTDAWGDPRGGIIADYPDGNRGGHAVVVVGYTTSGPRGRELLVKNSWGPDWGQGGYAWLSENMLNAHGNEAFVLEAARGGSPSFPTPTPNPSNPGTYPMPFGLPALPAIPGMPALPGMTPGATPGATSACPQGQVFDVVKQACSAPCANGLPPAGGMCLP